MENTVSRPPVTVGLCVKNNEGTVGEVIRSIVDVDYPNDRMEVIVVDGMSKDRTVEIAKMGLGNIRIAWAVLSDKDKGLSYARQMVFENSRGKYIVWIDGDNSIPRHFIKRHVETMERKSIIGASDALTIPKGHTAIAKLQGYQWLIPSLCETRVKREEKRRQIAQLGMQGTICRVEAIKDVGGFDLCLAGAGEDVDLFIRMQLNGWKIARTSNTWIYHSMRGNWKSLLTESIWWGYGRHYLSHKYPDPVGTLITKRTPLIPIDIVELTLKTFRLFRDPRGLLMPLHYLYRRLGFFLGFRKAHRDGYGHQYSHR